MWRDRLDHALLWWQFFIEPLCPAAPGAPPGRAPDAAPVVDDPELLDEAAGAVLVTAAAGAVLVTAAAGAVLVTAAAGAVEVVVLVAALAIAAPPPATAAVTARVVNSGLIL
jgi:hypothetical protein